MDASNKNQSVYDSKPPRAIAHAAHYIVPTLEHQSCPTLNSVPDIWGQLKRVELDGAKGEMDAPIDCTSSRKRQI